MDLAPFGIKLFLYYTTDEEKRNQQQVHPARNTQTCHVSLSYKDCPETWHKNMHLLPSHHYFSSVYTLQQKIS